MQDRMVWIIRLHKDDRFLRIDPCRQPVDQHFPGKFPDAARVGIVRREGMPIGEEEKAILLILQGLPIVQRAQEISQMHQSAGLHTA